MQAGQVANQQPAKQQSNVMQRATAAMMRAGVDLPAPMDGGGALRARPLPGGAASGSRGSPQMPVAGPGPVTATGGVRSPQLGPPVVQSPPPPQALEKEADRGGGPVVVRTLTDSQSEKSMQSTTAPSSSQPSVQMHGMSGQVKPPFPPRISQQQAGTSGEVLVAHVPMNPQFKSGSPAGPVHLSPLVRIREDRMSGMSSPHGVSTPPGSSPVVPSVVPKSLPRPQVQSGQPPSEPGYTIVDSDMRQS